MKRMLILGTNFGTMEIIKYAKSQGVYTIVTDSIAPEKSVAKLVADEYWMIDMESLDLLEERCRKEGIDAVFTGIRDYNIDLAMELNSRLGLSFYCTKEAWHYSRDKSDFKLLCKDVGVPVPGDYYVSDIMSEKELDSVAFPVVVKPVDMWGNRGVNYCYNKQDLIAAYKSVHSVSKSNKVIVERMLQGKEIVGYYALAEGKASLIALSTTFIQPGEPKNCYSIVTTVYDNVERYVDEMNPKVIELLHKVGCREGIAWVEGIYDKDNSFYMIEMGYRLFGDMMYIPYRNICGFDAIKWMTDCILQKKNSPDELPVSQTKAFTRCGCSYMLWTNDNVGEIAEINGLDEIAEIPGVTVEFLSQVGDIVTPHRPMGAIAFDADDCDEMCKMIEKINATVSIINTRGENVAVYFTDFEPIKETYKRGLLKK